jgi:ABC-type Fe3+ transport system substrate-binding protein
MVVDTKKSLAEIVRRYPETRPLFYSLGMERILSEENIDTLASKITLQSALAARNISIDAFIQRMEEVALSPASGETASTGDISLVGILPCPVKIPLMEAFENFLSQFEKDEECTVSADFKPASMGTAWIENHLGETVGADDLPHIFVSAGFDLFFDQKKIGHLRDAGVFKDHLHREGVNSAFAGCDLEDPQKIYSMLSGVPAVFLVNTEELRGRSTPRSWQDILSGGFEDSISLPVGDFDLFNAILLSLRFTYGEDAVACLGRSLQRSMHPSEMVKNSQRKTSRPAVTIMPYFFTKTVQNLSTVEVVWPSDGAVLSPIFMLTKKDVPAPAQRIVEFLGSREIGEILAHKGLFPSLHPLVDNPVEKGATFMWAGWDNLLNCDVGQEIERCLHIFEHGHTTRRIS